MGSEYIDEKECRKQIGKDDNYEGAILLVYMMKLKILSDLQYLRT